MNTQNDRRASTPSRILVAVDRDAISDAAIDAGLDYAGKFRARVEFVHAYSSPVFAFDASENPLAAISDLQLADVAKKDALERVRARLAAHGSSSRAEDVVRVVAGTPGRVVLERARESAADLVVLGALRKRPILDFGSTARAILAKSPCPVLTQPSARAEIRRIVVGLDFSSESRIALATACAWARALGAVVRVVHCFDTANASAAMSGIAVTGAIDELVRRERQEFESAIAAHDWNGVEHESAHFQDAPVSRMLAESERADLVVLGTHGRTGFTAALLGSVAYGVLKHATKPLLVVRDPKRAFQH